MSNYYYFASDKIQVFPCANRSKDEASRFTTEYNLTHLGACRTQIISSNDLSQTERWIQCWVKGYYFKFILGLNQEFFTTNANKSLYLQIDTGDSTTNTGDSIVTSVAQQSKLKPLEGTTLDQNSTFYGARITTEPSTGTTALLLRKGAAWQLPRVQDQVPSQLYLRNSNGVIYKITVNIYDTLEITKVSN